MWRFLRAVLGLLVGCMLVYGQYIVFTMRTHPNCPVVITSVSPSREFGFQTVTLLDDSAQSIESVGLTVVLATDSSQEEVVDGGRVFTKLATGERKVVDIFLGRIQALVQKAKELRQTKARAILFVDSVEFSDGTRWDGREPVLEIPLERPLPPK